MMPVSKATATWEGTLINGKGSMQLGSAKTAMPFSFATRFEGAGGTNPEELIGAAHSGCFSMAFSKLAGDAGFPPTHVETSANVSLEKTESGFAITKIELTMTADIPGIPEARFQELAAQAKSGCPVSKALNGVNIVLSATLK